MSQYDRNETKTRIPPSVPVIILLLILTAGILTAFLFLRQKSPAQTGSASSVQSVSSWDVSSASSEPASSDASFQTASGASSGTSSAASSGTGSTGGTVQPPKTSAVDKAYLNDAVFIGDSLTVAMGLYGYVDNSRVLADIGMNLDRIMTTNYVEVNGSKTTVLNAVKAKAPKKIYVMLGSNGIAWITPDKLTEFYETFLKALKEQNPGATIYLCSIPPVTAAKESSDSRYSNKKINTYNQKILELAKTYNVYFLDLHSVLVDDSGALPAELSDGDGVHLKAKAYQAIVDYYLTHTVQ